VATDHQTDDYEIDSEFASMGLALVHRWLSTCAVWALGRSRETVDTAARRSLTSLPSLVTAASSPTHVLRPTIRPFAWPCDAYVERDHRGCDLGTMNAAIPKAAGHGSIKG